MTLSIPSQEEEPERFDDGPSSTGATAIISHLHKYSSICKLHIRTDQKVKGRSSWFLFAKFKVCKVSNLNNCITKEKNVAVVRGQDLRARKLESCLSDSASAFT